MTPIRYRYTYPRSPLTESRIEAIIREGEPKCWQPKLVRLGQIGDRGIKRPQITEFRCEMDDGLLALFRPDFAGIEPQFSSVQVGQQPSRQHVAYVVSATVGAQLYPISAVRTFEHLGGRGSLTAAVDGEPFLLVDMQGNRHTKAVRNDREPTAVAEVYLFDFLSGNGQRIESSYLVDRPAFGPDGTRLPRRVRSQYQHESFSYTEDRRLQVAFENGDQSVSHEFWRTLQAAADHPLKFARLRNILGDALPQGLVARFFDRYSTILETRTFGTVQIFVR